MTDHLTRCPHCDRPKLPEAKYCTSCSASERMPELQHSIRLAYVVANRLRKEGLADAGEYGLDCLMEGRALYIVCSALKDAIEHGYKP